MPSFTVIIAMDVDGHTVRTTSDHPFYTDAGWVIATDLKAGDQVRTHGGTWATVRAVAVEGPQPVHRLIPSVLPYPSSGLLPAETLIQTAAGLKAIEDIRVGDYVVVPSSERN
jgi:hypothetical protein